MTQEGNPILSIVCSTEGWSYSVGDRTDPDICKIVDITELWGSAGPFFNIWVTPINGGDWSVWKKIYPAGTVEVIYQLPGTTWTR